MTITIEELYPDATPSELEEAEERLAAYVRLVLRIAERLEREAVDGTPEGP